MDRQTDNQQPNVSDVEVAWFAGFIDGEGSIMMSRRISEINRGKWQRKNCIQPRIALSNTNMETFDYVEDLLSRLGLPHHIIWRTWKNPKYKKAWDIRVQGMKRCRKWLLMLSPYLVTKKRQAELLLEWMDIRLSQNRKSPYTDRELAIMAEMATINH